jgi:hypothetical protein
MFYEAEQGALEVAQNEAAKIFNEIKVKPKVLSIQNLATFGSELGYACKLILEEKEILFFAILQWLSIGIGYILWTQIIDWIPNSVWEEIHKAHNSNKNTEFFLLNLVFLGWSFFVVIVVSYPLSLFSAAITASQYLKSSNQISTIFLCLNLASRHLGKLWIFTTIDAWITICRILERLPKKRSDGADSFETIVVKELLYYAWKIGTIGIQPALVSGKGYEDAVKDSINLLRTYPMRVIGIRMGYSLICWIVGIVAYIGGIFYILKFGYHNGHSHKMYNFFFTMIVPIFIAVGIICVLVRPFFLIMISKLYTDVIPLDKEMALGGTQSKRFNVLALFFAILLGTLLVLYFFGDQLGIRTWIESIAATDIAK